MRKSNRISKLDARHPAADRYSRMRQPEDGDRARRKADRDRKAARAAKYATR